MNCRLQPMAPPRTGTALAVAILLLVPAPANAGTVRVKTEGGPQSDFAEATVTYRAAPGEHNQVVVTLNRRRATVFDPAGVTPGARCHRPDRSDRRIVRCSLPRHYEIKASVLLGDRSDVGRLSRVPGALQGGSGDDLLIGGDIGNEFTGGPGNDRMLGGPEATRSTKAQPQAATMRLPGAGAASATELTTRNVGGPVIADLDGRRDDGQRGERDRLVGIENLTGGRGNDRLAGDGRENSLYGGGGGDRLSGRGGDDNVDGGGTYPPSRAGNRVSGGRGHDRLNGEAGPDLLVGGPGVDWINALGGNDRIRAQDGFSDSVRATSGCDAVSLDRDDWYLSRLVAFDAQLSTRRCGSVRRNGAAGLIFQPDYTPGIVDYREVNVLVRSQFAEMIVGCPGDAPPVCEARVSVLRGDQTLGRTSISLRRNGVRT